MSVDVQKMSDTNKPKQPKFTFRDTDVLDFMNIPFPELAVDWS